MFGTAFDILRITLSCLLIAAVLAGAPDAVIIFLIILVLITLTVALTQAYADRKKYYE